MFGLLLLAQSISLHSAWPGPAIPPPPPEYNAVVGDPIPPSAPEQRWLCKMDASSKMGTFELRIGGGKVKRFYAAAYQDTFDVVANSTLGLVAVRTVDDIENGQPGIGAYNLSLNKMNGEAVFEGVFVSQRHNLPVNGSCSEEPSPVR